MARIPDRPHDPFSPPVPAFPTNRLRSAGVSEERLVHLADRFDEMTTAGARKFVNDIRTHPTHQVAEMFAVPAGDAETLAEELHRDRLVLLAASYGRPISGNKAELAAEVVEARDLAASNAAALALLAQRDDEDDDEYADRLAALAQAADESPEAYAERLAALTAQADDQGPDEGEGTTDAPQGQDEAPAGDQGVQTDPAGDPIDPAAPTTVAPEGTPDETPAGDAPAEVEVTHQDGTTETVTGVLPVSAEVPAAPAEGTIDQVTDTQETVTPGETTEAVQGDTPAPVEGDAPVAVEGDTVTAVTGDASPEVSASMTAAAPAKRARPSRAKAAKATGDA